MNVVDFGFRFDALPLLIIFIYGVVWIFAELKKQSAKREHNRRVARAQAEFDQQIQN